MISVRNSRLEGVPPGGGAETEPIALNLPPLMQGLAAALCLLGFSSASGHAWMAYVAGALALYTVCTAVPLRRVASVSAAGIARRAPYGAAIVLAAVVGVALADAPYLPLAAAGSLTIVALLLFAGAACALLVFRALRALAPAALRSASAGLERLLLYAGLLLP